LKIEVSTISLPTDQGGDAPAQEAGTSESMDVPEGATVADVLGRLGERRAQVQKVLVNGDDAEDSRPLREGDAVALVGQVSGM
jgi:molybdopterin converting factor small subunit